MRTYFPFAVICGPCGVRTCRVCGGCECVGNYCTCGPPELPAALRPADSLVQMLPQDEVGGELVVIRLTERGDAEEEQLARWESLDRAACIARAGLEEVVARAEETEEEKWLRWDAERRLRAVEEYAAWEWRPHGGKAYIVQTHSRECETVDGYLVTAQSCSCPDWRKRGERVMCKHQRGLQLHLIDLLDRAYPQAA